MNDQPDIVAAAQDRIGHVFFDATLLRAALTHPSYASEHPGVEHYERLEFLGDAVLGLVVAERLFAELPDASEGELTRRKIAAVAGRRLTAAARDLRLDELIVTGHGETAQRGGAKASVLENVLEAIIGAVYLDAGLPAARRVVERVLGDVMLAGHRVEADPKSALQEHTQALGLGLPRYRLVEESGPPHDPRFTVEVLLGDRALASGSGSSKKEAEKAAAAAALERLREAPPGR